MASPMCTAGLSCVLRGIQILSQRILLTVAIMLSIAASASAGNAVAVELNTGPYADAVVEDRDQQRRRVVRAVKVARREGLEVLAGHGLTYRNVLPIAAIGEIDELNIGHSIMSRAMFTGIDEAVRTIQALMSPSY